MPGKQLILFDLDGVILDSRPNMERSWREVCANTAIDVPFELYFAEIGRPFREILRRLGVEEHAEEAEKIFRIASMQNLSLARFYEGTEETLAALQERDIRIGLVTSKDTQRTNAIIALLPVDFITVQTPTGRYRGKPAPDYLLVAMAEAGVDPGDTLYVGDMDVDFQAAQRAGVDYVHAEWGYGSMPAPDCPKISRFADLLSVLDS